MSKSSEQYMDQEQIENEPINKGVIGVEPLNLRAVQESKLNKVEMDRLTDNMVTDVADGDTEALPRYIRVDFLLKALTAAKKKLKEFAMDDVSKYAKQGESFQGVGFKSKNYGGGWTYDHNQTWQEAKDRLDEIQEQMKMAAKNPGTEIIDKDGGEVVPPAKPKASTESIELTFPKDKPSEDKS